MKKTLLATLLSIPLIFTTYGCEKKVKEIDPFVGKIIGEGRAGNINNKNTNDDVYSYSIIVEELKNKQVEIFTYSGENSKGDSEIAALDDAFNKGDVVKIRRWDNEKYDFPSKQ